MRVADDVFAGEGEGIAGGEVDEFGLNDADAHLRPRQVGHNGDGATSGLFGRADAGDTIGMITEFAMRKIKSRDVEAGTNEFFQHFRGV